MSPQCCPTCDSPQPHLHPAVQWEGEVHICRDLFHRIVTPENTAERILERLGADPAPEREP